MDLSYSVESKDETSKTNLAEAKCTLVLLQHFYDSLCSGSVGNFKGKIGIISPYKAQVRILKDTIYPWLRKIGCSPSADLEINTVDAYQGREKDIIVINCVRSNETGSLGFLADERRVNVAITRAKHYLFVIGNSQTLEQHPLLGGFIAHCKQAKPEKSWA